MPSSLVGGSSTSWHKQAERELKRTLPHCSGLLCHSVHALWKEGSHRPRLRLQCLLLGCHPSNDTASHVPRRRVLSLDVARLVRVACEWFPSGEGTEIHSDAKLAKNPRPEGALKPLNKGPINALYPLTPPSKRALFESSTLHFSQAGCLLVMWIPSFVSISFDPSFIQAFFPR